MLTKVTMVITTVTMINMVTVVTDPMSHYSLLLALLFRGERVALFFTFAARKLMLWEGDGCSTWLDGN